MTTELSDKKNPIPDVKYNKKNNIYTIKPDRMMAFVAQINEIQPIKGRDKIMLAKVRNWQAVIKKDEYKEKQLIVFVMPDSVLDENNKYFKFMEGYPVKIKKIFGVYSHGLVLPLDCVEDKIKENKLNCVISDGLDVTSILGVEKHIHDYEVEIYSSTDDTKAKSLFPDDVPKTDEERINNKMDLFNKIKDKVVVLTEKRDGTSFTVFRKNKKGYIANRNNLLLTKLYPYTDIATKYDLIAKLEKLDRNIAIQGEITGPKINGNRDKLKDIELEVFRIYDIDNHKFVSHDEMVKICAVIGIKTVPILRVGVLDEKECNITYLKKYANELKTSNGNLAEGIVLNTLDRHISVKILSEAYMVKHDS